MFRLFCVTVFMLLTTVSADDSEKSCMKLREFVNQSMTCCEEHPVKSDYKEKLKEVNKFDEMIDECKEKSHKAEGKECSEREMCMAKNLGLTKDNGDIDKDAINKLYEKEIQEILDDEVYEKIKKYCIDSEPKDEDMCYFKHLEHCTGRHFIINCRKWSEDDSCAAMKDTVNECLKNYS